MTSWQAGDVEVQGVRLHYTRTGGDKPALVLAHGFSDDGLCWMPVAQALAAEYDVIMPDARCHGQSAAPAESFGALDQAADLAGIISQLELPRPIVLGHSMGAITTLALAGTYPDLPRAILLEDPPAWWMSASRQAPADEQWQTRMRAWLTELKQKTREELIEQQRAQTPHWSNIELETWADSKLRLHLNVFNRNTAAGIDWPALAGQVACPALLITGDPQRGAIVTAEQAAALQTLIPNLRVAHIPEAGHSIRRDRFDLYMEAVRDFLMESTQGGL